MNARYSLKFRSEATKKDTSQRQGPTEPNVSSLKPFSHNSVTSSILKRNYAKTFNGLSASIKA
jgi:hypothetical protein